MRTKFENSDHRFRIIFENSLAVMLLIDPETYRIIAANKAAEQYYGWKRSRLEQMLISDINALSPAELKIEMEKARLSERIYFRFKHRLASGEVRNVEVYSGKVQIEEKDYLHSIIHDVTQQVDAENALKQSQLYNRMLFEQSPVGLALTTMEGNLADINPAFAAIIGRTIEETKQLSYWDITPEKYAKREQEQLESLEKTGHYGPYEKEYIHKDGHLVAVRLQGLIFYRDNEKYIWSSVEDISKQKKAVEEQIKSLNLLNNLAAQVPGVVYQYRLYADGSSAFPYASPGMWDIYEVTPEEVREDASKVFTRIHPDDYDYIVATITESAQNLSNYESEFRVILPKQGLRWRYSNARPERMDDGSTLWHGIITDITARKLAEEALSHSHELMKYIIEHNQSAVAVHDRDLKYLYVSQRYLSDYRVTESDVIGKHHYEVFPDIPEKWRKVHQKALRGIVSRADEDIFYREDGSFDWTRWECRPWHEANGSIGGIIIYTEVINEQKRKEEEIKKLNQRLEILIESIQQLSSAQSLESVQKIVTKYARKLIGADGATLVFRENDHCFYANEDAIQPLWKGNRYPLHSCISGWVMQNKKPVVVENVFLDKRIPQDIYNPTFVKSMVMVPVNTQAPVGAIGNYWKEEYTPTDTEMQLLQTLADAAARAIESINFYTELEERVSQRTEQLHAANKELETFTYSVSHDLKAPLRGIDGYSKLLLDDYGSSLNEEAACFIKTIRSSTLQMNRLIEDLLSYSRLERSHFKQEEIALKSFVETIVSNFDEELKKDGFQVAINIPDVNIIADSTGLSIALRNFLENAIKFSCQVPEPRIDIDYSEEPHSWIIAVKDNGVGFDMKYHDRIFDIFQRLHRSENFPGTGIGLAMVAKALQRMEGKAWAESSPGKGSAFFMEIPKTNER